MFQGYRKLRPNLLSKTSSSVQGFHGLRWMLRVGNASGAETPSALLESNSSPDLRHDFLKLGISVK